MSSFEHPVHFTQSAHFDVDAGQLVFHDVISSSIVSRSSVLSCVAEAGGEAKLPDMVTVSDFKQWLSAVTDTPSELRARRFGFMCNVVMVADVIDDMHASDFIHAAARGLRQAILDTCSNETKQEIIEGFSVLAAHLQHHVFEAAAFQSEDLPQLLTFFPTSLHASLLTWINESEKMIRIYISDTLPLMVKALACLPASPPSVLSVEIHDRPQARGVLKISEAVAHLTTTLHHHTGLTSLVLPSWVIGDTSFNILLSAIASLQSLMTLRFGDKHVCRISPERAAELKSTLCALPKLHELKLHMEDVRADVDGKSIQRLRGALAPPLPSRVCLADMLSPLTALTALDLRAYRTVLYRSDVARVFTAGKLLVLPHLVHLAAMFGCNVHLAARFFSRLRAPLTSLDLAHRSSLQMAEYRLAGRDAEAPEAACRLLYNLSALTQLRRFRAVLPLRGAGGNSMRRALTTALPRLLTRLHQLQDCALATERDVMLRAVRVLAATATSLTQLRLGVYPSTRFPDDDDGGAAAWAEIFGHLCRCSQLHHLGLDAETACEPQTHGLSSLSLLTQLTALHLCGWSCLRRPADGEALARMTRLQSLCLDDTVNGHDLQPPGDTLAPLQQLAAVTSLTLRSTPGGYTVSALIASVPPETLPALQELAVAMYNPFGEAPALARYAAELPALSRLSVHVLLTPAYLHEEDLRRHGSSDAPGGEGCPHAEVLQQCSAAEASLQHGADSAGIELALDRTAIDRLLQWP